MRTPRFAPAAVALALFTAACGDSTGPQIELSEAEAEEVQAAIFDVLSDLGLEFGFSRSNPTLPGLFLSSAGMPPINETASCDEGGNVSANGNFDETEESVDFELTIAFNNCGENGHTIDGDLDYAGDGSFTSETSFSFHFTINGTLTVTLPDDRSGSCTFDVEFDFDNDGASVSGTVCGEDVSGSATF